VRVCFFNVTTTVLVGGLETYCRELASELAKLGCTVDILGGKSPGPPGVHVPGVRVVTFPFYPAEKVPVGGTRGSRLVERLTFAYNARHFFLSQNYDIVVIVKPFDFPAMFWSKRKKDFKVVYRSGGREFYVTDRFFMRCVDHFISSSHYNADQLRIHYEVPVEVIHNGVDINKFTPLKRGSGLAQSLGLSERRVVITVGRVVGWKGLQILMDALPIIKRVIPNISWVVIGGGEYLDVLQTKCREMKLEDSVIFVGEIPHEKLPEHISLADVMVQPSIAEEAFGITLVEAMACGIPAIGSRIGGIPEIIVDRQTGFLVTPRDREALADSVIKILEDDDLRRSYGASARERVVEHFTWAANAGRHLEAFRSLTGGK